MQKTSKKRPGPKPSKEGISPIRSIRVSDRDWIDFQKKAKSRSVSVAQLIRQAIGKLK